MRLPIPQRFKTVHVILFAVSVLIAQIMEGTDLTFALLFFLYILLSATAFNVAGGITFPSGAWIFFTSTLTCTVGLVYKIFLNEPGETHLLSPVVSMGAYCVAMAGMGLAAYICSRVRPRRGLLAGMAMGDTMKPAAIGCLVFGLGVTFLGSSASSSNATISSAVAQLNHFTQLAIILATSYQIRKSGGTRSFNWIVFIGGSFFFVFGIVGFSKESMFIPFLTWIVPCIAARYEFSKAQIIGGIIVIGLMLYYLVPLSQYGRRSRDVDGNLSIQAVAAWQYLTHPNETRQLYLDSNQVTDADGSPHLYDHSGGLFDRLQMLAFDDALINYTETTETIGLTPTYNSFLNVIPHFIWKDKPVFADGNAYGRLLGVISADDTSTGISFSPVGDAYHQASWLGVGLLLPAIMLMLFLVMDSLAGDVRASPWGLLLIALGAHLAPEGLLVGAVWMSTFGAESIIVAALISTYVLPRIIILVTGGERTRIRKSRDFKIGEIAGPRMVSTLHKPGPETTTAP